ncbi:hypothetical protein AKJ57_05640 [candidate division MSBL1 archaeon SCGC-AAA259A05]|uniref:Transposase IS66 central domain-containing protein n=1 Tax=candidate division MSBL1 archaeon SCGC-AAA259A05 TaxID=1698259 RepID=A0A133U4W2_9EURY|nr:hypothetical protein AKJ57_05640 [candidate division MSBL1 archaeon SCGC-AAA259A05]
MSSQSPALPECSSTCLRVIELEGRIEELEEENAELKARVALKNERIKKLWNELGKYRNPHTPPSRRLGSSHSKRRTSRRKPGRRRDPKGVTRTQPKPQRTVVVAREECLHCGGELGELESVETRVIEDIPEPQPLEVTKYKIGHYFCETCGKEVTASHPDLPPKGRLGYNVAVQTTISKFEQRIPPEKIVNLLKWQYGLKLSTAATYDLMRRVANWLRTDYEEILQKVRSADVVYVDETSIKVNGRKGWIWIFTMDDATLFTIRMSRGKKVLKEVLGSDFYGTIVSDGWSSYATHVKNIAANSDLQRCWAHLLREADDLKSEEGKRLARKLHEIYGELKTFLLRDPPPGERERKKEWAIASVKDLIEQDYENGKVIKLMKKIKNGFDHWFTFLRDPELEPTNNRAERALREHVVQRKIIGTLRNEKGMKIHETITTILATWEQNGLDPYEEMLKAFRNQS